MSVEASPGRCGQADVLQADRHPDRAGVPPGARLPARCRAVWLHRHHFERPAAARGLEGPSSARSAPFPQAAPAASASPIETETLLLEAIYCFPQHSGSSWQSMGAPVGAPGRSAPDGHRGPPGRLQSSMRRTTSMILPSRYSIRPTTSSLNSSGRGRPVIWVISS